MKEQMELTEVFCPCGCGMTIGQPMEFIDGQWIITPVSEERLRSLDLARHPKIHSESRSVDRSPLTFG
jgi:hypothetical protein